MGAPKQKWTPEEEAALRAGVEKYGAGKWRAIQKDPKFQDILKQRSNVDLKDKWRNLNGPLMRDVNNSNDKWRNLSVGPGQSRQKGVTGNYKKPTMDMMPPMPMHPFSDTGAFPVPATPTDLSPHASSYDDFIVEAVATMKQPAGTNFASIANYLEERHGVPPNFRKVLSARLKALCVQGKLIKVEQNYKLNDGGWKGRGQSNGMEEDDKLRNMRSRKGGPRFGMEAAQKIVRNAEEAAFIAARAVAEAEAAAHAAEVAAREAEAAEADAEAKEIAAEAAAFHARPHKRMRFAAPPMYCNPISTQS